MSLQRAVSALLLIWILSYLTELLPRAPLLWILAGLLALSSAVLFISFGGSLRPANLVTGIRGAAAVGLLIAAPFLLGGGGGETLIFVLALAAAVTDFLDGFLARRERRSGTAADAPEAAATAGLSRRERFGPLWDAETDAAFMLALSALVAAYTPLGPWVLAIGGMRYLFGIAFVLTPELDHPPKRFTWFSKTVCAIAVGALVAALFPPLPEVPALVANLIALGLLLTSFGWELVLRFGGAGMLRTLVIYYLLPFRQRRMRRLYRLFIREGDLAFDIGAHVGNRVLAWRGLGARVVAVEPQPACLRILRRYYGAAAGVSIEPVAVGDRPGRQTLYISDEYPTLSSISEGWIEKVSGVSSFSHVSWNRRVETEVRTLEELIRDYGLPAFVKIDVEGHEPAVLAGLERPLPALSFEFLPASVEAALGCISRLEELGSYEYNYAMVETARLQEERWLGAEDMRGILRGMPETGPSGDVYARLRAPARSPGRRRS